MRREVMFGFLGLGLLVVGLYVFLQGSITGNVISAPAQDVKDTIVFLHAGTLLASQTEGETSFYVQDHLGSSRAVASGSDDEKQLTTYSPFGVTEVSKSTENDYLYTGKERDAETGLYYYGARYYQPSVGRFVSSDALTGSLDEPLALQRYAYVQNNPLKFVDPSGNEERSFAERMTAARNKELLHEARKEAFVSIVGTRSDPAILGDMYHEVFKGNIEEAGLQVDDFADVASLGASVVVSNIAEKIVKEVTEDLVGSRLAKEVSEEFAEQTVKEAAENGAGDIVVKSAIEGKYVKFAQQAGKDIKVQRDLNSLENALFKGDIQYGSGTKVLPATKGVYEMKKGAARLYFRYQGEGIEIIAKSSKANQEKVIKTLRSDFPPRSGN